MQSNFTRNSGLMVNISELWWWHAVILLRVEGEPGLFLRRQAGVLIGGYRQDEDKLPLRQGQVVRQQDGLCTSVHLLLRKDSQVSQSLKVWPDLALFCHFG